jgi:uncharacterized membrane protein YkvA (DUF1232 family)
MSEVANYVMHGASQITPTVVEKVLRSLPLWKVEFAQINAPHYPHLVDQLEFLADVVEDAADGVYKELPYNALAAAVFAIMYAHRKTDIIPDSLERLGYADDSSIARAALIMHERAFKRYAESHDLDWEKVTSMP